MEGTEVISFVKKNYSFKEGYSLLIGFDNNEYWGFAYRTITLVNGKKVESKSDIMLSSICTKDKNDYKGFIETYCNKI